VTSNRFFRTLDRFPWRADPRSSSRRKLDIGHACRWWPLSLLSAFAVNLSYINIIMSLWENRREGGGRGVGISWERKFYQSGTILEKRRTKIPPSETPCNGKLRRVSEKGKKQNNQKKVLLRCSGRLRFLTKTGFWYSTTVTEETWKQVRKTGENGRKPRKRSGQHTQTGFSEEKNGFWYYQAEHNKNRGGRKVVKLKNWSKKALESFCFFCKKLKGTLTGLYSCFSVFGKTRAPKFPFRSLHRTRDTHTGAPVWRRFQNILKTVFFSNLKVFTGAPKTLSYQGKNTLRSENYGERAHQRTRKFSLRKDDFLPKKVWKIGTGKNENRACRVCEFEAHCKSRSRVSLLGFSPPRKKNESEKKKQKF